jgi:hypothetical protein
MIGNCIHYGGGVERGIRYVFNVILLVRNVGTLMQC